MINFIGWAVVVLLLLQLPPIWALTIAIVILAAK